MLLCIFSYIVQSNRLCEKPAHTRACTHSRWGIGGKSRNAKSPFTFTEQLCHSANYMQNLLREGKSGSASGHQILRCHSPKEFLLPTSPHRSFPCHILPFLRHAVALMTAKSLMDSMQSLSEQIGHKISQAKQDAGSYSGA